MPTFRHLLLIACMAAATTAHAEVTDAAADGFTVENSRTAPVGAIVAWKALVEDVNRWWPKDHTWWGEASTLSIEPRAGGVSAHVGRHGANG